MPRNTKTFSLRFEPELLRELRALAKHTDTTISQIIRRGVRHVIAELKDAA